MIITLLKHSMLLLLTSFTLIMSSPTFAANEMEQLNTLLAQTKTLEAHFSQVVDGSRMSGSRVYTGKFYMERPSKFRWVVETPDKQTLVADGKNLWIYDEDLAQVTVQELNKELGNTPALLLSGEVNAISDAFKVSLGKGTRDAQWFDLTPRDPSSLIAHVSLGFTQDKVKYMILTDGTGQTTRLTFTDIVINSALPKTLFQFTPPEQVDVIGEPQK